MGSIPTVVSVILVVAGAIGVPLALYLARERAHTIAAEAEREAQTRRQVTVIRETRAVDYAR